MHRLPNSIPASTLNIRLHQKSNIPADVLNDMIAELNAAEDKELDEKNPVVSSTDGKEKEDDLSESDKADLLFADGNSSKAYDELKLMLRAECTIE